MTLSLKEAVWLGAWVRAEGGGGYSSQRAGPEAWEGAGPRPGGGEGGTVSPVSRAQGRAVPLLRLLLSAPCIRFRALASWSTGLEAGPCPVS